MLRKEKLIQNIAYLALRDVMCFVEECVKEGYTVPHVDSNEDFPRDFGMGSYRIVMVKETTEQEDVLRELEDLNGKDELLAFAAKHSVEVSDAVKIPTAIKKAIKIELEERHAQRECNGDQHDITTNTDGQPAGNVTEHNDGPMFFGIVDGE